MFSILLEELIFLKFATWTVHFSSLSRLIGSRAKLCHNYMSNAKALQAD